ncbi:MAG: hypothetical protein AABZ01_07870 [Gemmatimonadota bacterium]
MFLAILANLLSAPVQLPDSVVARVYAVVLDSLHIDAGTTSLFVYGRTVTGVGHVDDSDYRNGVRGLSPLPEGLQDDFEARRTARSIVPPIPTRVPTLLLTDSLAATLPRPMSAAFWEEMRNRFQDLFPGLWGMIGVSPVGFSTDRQWAMVMVDHPMGTVYYLLALRDGRWVITRSATVREV